MANLGNRTRPVALLLLLALTGSGLAGCGATDSADSKGASNDSSSIKAAPSDGSETGADVGTPARREITLQITDGAGLASALAEHRGKVVLVDFWATWCAPCRQMFPHVRELADRHADEGLVVVTVSLDDPDNLDSSLDFLKSQGADFQNWIAADGAGTKTLESFNLRGDVPLYRLYDRQGELVAQFSERPEGLEQGVKFEELDSLVAQTVEQK